MFHANDSRNGMGTLKVKNGRMVFHVALAGKSILNLYYGKAEQAKADEKNWLSPVEDKVTYADGYSETVYAFDIPLVKLDSEFDLALIGKKGVWYDHKVSVKNAKPLIFAKGTNEVSVKLSGGSGKAALQNPAKLFLDPDSGKKVLTVEWTSKNYDYMIVDGVKYLNENPGKNSTFTFPVKDIVKEIPVLADTTAMGNPHEIEYEIEILY